MSSLKTVVLCLKTEDRALPSPGGEPLFYYVLAAAEQSDADDVIVATSSGEIAQAIRGLIGKYNWRKVRVWIDGQRDIFEELIRPEDLDHVFVLIKTLRSDLHANGLSSLFVLARRNGFFKFLDDVAWAFTGQHYLDNRPNVQVHQVFDPTDRPAPASCRNR